MEIHTLPHHCDRCPISTTTARNMERHEDAHEPAAELQCPISLKTFTRELFFEGGILMERIQYVQEVQMELNMLVLFRCGR